MSFKEFVNNNIKIATEVLKRRGVFQPQVVFAAKDDHYGIALLAIDKPMWDKVIRDLVQKYEAKYVVLITETWFVEAEKKEEAFALPPSKHPFRKEALVLTAYAKTGEKDLAMIPFERVDPKTIVMEEPKREKLEFVSNIFQNPWA